MRNLSRQEFEATFSDSMLDVTNSAEEVVDLWSYAEPALRAAFPEICSCDFDVESIYESDDGHYQHVLIPSHIDNVYLTVVIDKKKRSIIGHHRLDLNALYGLDDDA